MKKVFILILLVTLIFAGCGKPTTSNTKTNNDENSLTDPISPFDSENDIQTSTEANTTTIITTSVTTKPNVTTTAPAVTTTPETTKPIDSLSLHKNEPEYIVQKIEGSDFVNPDGTRAYKTNAKTYKIGDVINIRRNALTFRITKVSESNFNYSNNKNANEIKKVYDIEMEVCAKYKDELIIYGILPSIYLNNTSPNNYCLNNPIRNSRIYGNKVSVFHFYVGLNNELVGNIAINFRGQVDSYILHVPFAITLSSNEIIKS